ncbi:ABC transporter ATP-binding protein, partial [Streptomyces nigrescens]
LVSHNNKSIRDTCDRVLWLEHGELLMDGPTDEVIKAYEKETGK